VNNILLERCEEETYMKYKWYGFINKQKMINDFKEIFGSPEKVEIIIGDYDEKGCYMKGKRIRKIFKKLDIIRNLYLVNEYNTSCELYQTCKALVRCKETRTPLSLKMLHEKRRKYGQNHQTKM
jgi:hypothetical protein